MIEDNNNIKSKEQEQCSTSTKVYYLSGKSSEKLRNIIRKKIDNGENIVVVTTDIWNKGINLRQLKSLVIAGGMKSFVLTNQRVGRGLRRVKGLKEKIYIVDFWDNTHPVLKRQSKKRYKIYMENGFNVKILNLDNKNGNSK